MIGPVTVPELDPTDGSDGSDPTDGSDADRPADLPEAPGATARWTDVWLVVAVAVVVRVAVGVALARDPQGLHDPYLYRAFARGLADGNGYVGLLGRPTAYYPPGYPLFLGALQWVADSAGRAERLPLVAAMVQAVLGGVAAGATAVAAARLVPAQGAAQGPAARGSGSVRRPVLVAGLVVALWPNFVLYGSVLLSETLFVALFAVFVAAVLSLHDLRGFRAGPTVVAAASLGAATLVRPQVLVSLPFLVGAWLLAMAGWRRVLWATSALAAGVVLFVAPWTVRNAVVLGHVVPISTNSGDNLCIGFHPAARGGYDFGPECRTDGGYVDGPDVEVRRDAQNRDRALAWVSSNLAALPALSARKIWYTFNSDRDGLRAVESYEDDRFLPGGVRRAIGLVADGAYGGIMAAALVGAVVSVRDAVRRRPGALVLLGLTAGGIVVPALFFGDPRFKVALVPCLALLAAVGVNAACRGWTRRRSRREDPRTPTWEDRTRPAR